MLLAPISADRRAEEERREEERRTVSAALSDRYKAVAPESIITGRTGADDQSGRSPGQRSLVNGHGTWGRAGRPPPRSWHVGPGLPQSWHARAEGGPLPGQQHQVG